MMYDLAETEDFDREEIATYEEVARLFPRPGTFRPIILVGPPGYSLSSLSICGGHCLKVVLWIWNDLFSVSDLDPDPVLKLGQVVNRQL